MQVEQGAVKARDLVTAEVSDELRDATRRNHTATHLLHAALRRVLGTHVKQAGSMVSPERLRFDFVHYAPLTHDEIAEIERLVTVEVCRNTPVQTEVRSTQEAVAAGAMALFGEKYGDTVRVVSVPGFSMELCGGTHCRATGDIGPFVVLQEGGIAAGVRRIEALTGLGALRHIQGQHAALAGVLTRLNVGAAQAGEAIDRLHAEVKRLGREIGQARMKAASGGVSAAGEVVEIGDVRVLTRKVDDLDAAALRELADNLKGTLGRGVVVLGAAAGDKVQFVISVTSDLTGRVHAGKLVKQLAPIVGGGGGGRPDFAQAGGRQPEKLDDLLAASREAIRGDARILKFSSTRADTAGEDHGCLENRLRARPRRRGLDAPPPRCGADLCLEGRGRQPGVLRQDAQRRTPHLRRARVGHPGHPPGDRQARGPLRRHHRRGGCPPLGSSGPGPGGHPGRVRVRPEGPFAEGGDGTDAAHAVDGGGAGRAQSLRPG